MGQSRKSHPRSDAQAEPGFQGKSQICAETLRSNVEPGANADEILFGRQERMTTGPTSVHPDGSPMWIWEGKAYFSQEAWSKARQGLIP